MTTLAQVSSQVTEKKGRLARLSLRKKVIGAVLLLILVLTVISIPGNRQMLTTFRDNVVGAQATLELAQPIIASLMDNVVAAINASQVDLSENRGFTGLTGAVNSFNRTSSPPANRYGGMVTFYNNVNSFLNSEHDNYVPELDTSEFRALVADMDLAVIAGLEALQSLNFAVDQYNGYHNWFSATVTSMLFGLPQGYPDPLTDRSNLLSDLGQ